MLVVIGVTCLHHKHMTYGQLSHVTNSFLNVHVDSMLISKISGVSRMKGNLDCLNIFFSTSIHHFTIYGI